MISKCPFTVLKIFLSYIKDLKLEKMSSYDPNTKNNSRVIHEIMYFKVHLSEVLFKLFLFKNYKTLSVNFNTRFEDKTHLIIT